MASFRRPETRDATLIFACLFAATPALASAKPAPNVDWATYYGGENPDSWDWIEAIAAAPDGGVLVAGSGGSPTVFASPGAHQTTYGGGGDTFLARFDAKGKRLWGTYYGGSDDEYAEAVAVDPTRGAIFLAGTTYSNDRIATPGSHLPEHPCNMPGIPDCNAKGFLARFDVHGHRLWGTFFGGSNDDLIYAAAVDDAGNVYICGDTSSPDGVATPGTYKPSMGVEDGSFLAKFSGNGRLS